MVAAVVRVNLRWIVAFLQAKGVQLGSPVVAANFPQHLTVVRLTKTYPFHCCWVLAETAQVHGHARRFVNDIERRRIPANSDPSCENGGRSDKHEGNRLEGLQHCAIHIVSLRSKRQVPR